MCRLLKVCVTIFSVSLSILSISSFFLFILSIPSFSSLSTSSFNTSFILSIPILSSSFEFDNFHVEETKRNFILDYRSHDLKDCARALYLSLQPDEKEIPTHMIQSILELFQCDQTDIGHLVIHKQ